MLLEGDRSAKILFVSDFLRVNCLAEKRVLAEGIAKPLVSAIKQAGLLEADISWTVIHPRCPKGGKDVNKISSADRHVDLATFKALLSTHAANVIVPLGEYAMEVVTGLKGIGKWQSNVVRAKAEFEGRKCVPLFHPADVLKNFGDSFYLAFGCQRIKTESESREINIPKRTFKLAPSFNEAMRLLSSLNQSEPLAIDIETGQGLINTFGFATSPTEAVAIRTLPECYEQQEFFQLWLAIQKVLESSQPKILQNFIYEATWFARYGIELRHVAHDTMWAQKFLHPELDKGLDNVGRLSTPYPYWKDDNDDWTQIRDWTRHLDYNCKDTTGTYAAFLSQRVDLEERGLQQLFDNFIMRFAPVIQEMCTRGLKVDPQALLQLQEKLRTEQENYSRILETEFSARLNKTVNPRSPKQLQQALKDLGFALPTKRKKNAEELSETADKKALVKLRKKYPKEPVFPALIGLSSTNKQLSSYANFDYDRTTNRVHYQLDGCGTETGRWAGYLSGWGEGFNPQTVPKSARRCFIADHDKALIQIDLAQAESRYVAWESPEPKLISMLEAGEDVHKYVAGRIFKKPAEIVSKAERQLGKKSGHAANYSVGARTFAEACLVEMGLYITEDEARRIIQTYYEVFPGIRTRQENIRKEVQMKRMLKTPIGRERHFYGRMDDSTFREAYAYCPQSVIPDITNHLMLKLWEFKDALDVEFLLQVHDSLLLQAPLDRVGEIAELAKDLQAWHPKIKLAGGELWIPVEVEYGQNWLKMETI